MYYVYCVDFLMDMNCMVIVWIKFVCVVMYVLFIFLFVFENKKICCICLLLFIIMNGGKNWFFYLVFFLWF